MAEPMELGSFLLDSRIGVGGMADVWAGVHQPSGKDVAVKILHSEAARDPIFVASFRNEIRAIAQLHHPHIVRVWDQGLVSDAFAEASGGRITGRSPYLVMELAEGGSLSSLMGKLSWPELRGVLLAVLDALAHAHARGVVHRDIKPANVLLKGSTGVVRLTDFGLVHLLDRDELDASDACFIGTPAYMAPEQLECRWRDYGPWTDLYAVGCLAFALSSGSTPFGGSTELTQTVYGHLHEALPELSPRRRVPPGFEEWVRVLAAKNPARRFRRASEAAWALASLPPLDESDPDSTFGSTSRIDLGVTQTLALPSQASLDAGGFVTQQLAATASETSHGTAQLVSHRLQEVPVRWQRPCDESQLEASTPLPGVGLKLYGLQSLGLVGRISERDLLWERFREVALGGRARMVLLSGAAGCGKSYLASWLCARAHEVGGATVLRARHSSRGSEGDGLSGMLARHFRCQKLDRRETSQQIQKRLSEFEAAGSEDEALALTELVQPAGIDGSRGVDRVIRFAGPTERYAVLRRHVERLGTIRPVILYLDDTQWALDALRFAAQLLLSQSASPSPVLIVGTCSDEILPERASEAALLQDLAELDGVERLPLSRLADRERRELVQRLLGLEPTLAARVEQRSQGNPLFAVQLVGDWVVRGLLEAGEDGFRLAPGSDAALPDDLHEVWTGRIDRIVSGRSEEDAQALELAAALGQSVDTEEWLEACREASLEPGEDLIEQLVDQALAIPAVDGHDSGWSFVHAMLRESLERRAVEGGRSHQHHQACAAMLETGSAHPPPLRLGRHLLAAQQTEKATDCLLAALEDLLLRGETQQAGLLLEELEPTLSSRELQQGSPLAVRAMLFRSRLARRSGKVDLAVRGSRAALRLARRDHEGALLGRALLEAGGNLVAAGSLAEGSPLVLEAIEVARKAEDKLLLAESYRHLSYLRGSQGRLAEATEAARQSIFDHEELGDGLGVAHSYQMLSDTSARSGDLARSSFLLEEARLRFERAGARWGVAACLNTQGDIARQRGRLEEAERAYREAAELYELIGSGDSVYPRTNLALILVEQDRFEEAEKLARGARDTFEAQGRSGMVGACSVILLPCFAAAQDWLNYDEELDTALKTLRATGFVEPDIARVAERAAEITRQTGQRARTGAALIIALEQWEALDRPERVEAVRLAIES